MAWPGDKNFQQLQVQQAASSAKVAGQLLVQGGACPQEQAAAVAQVLALQLETRSNGGNSSSIQTFKCQSVAQE